MFHFQIKLVPLRVLGKTSTISTIGPRSIGPSPLFSVLLTSNPPQIHPHLLAVARKTMLISSSILYVIYSVIYWQTIEIPPSHLSHVGVVFHSKAASVVFCCVWLRLQNPMVMFLEGKIPEQKIQDGHLFPKVVVPANDSQRGGIDGVLESIKGEEKAWLENELRECGAILFRGFAIKTAADFNAFMERLGWEEQRYRGTAPRTNIVGRVWSANEAPLDQHIFFHHEMALYEDFPSKIIFFCEVAPPEGGETAVVLSHRVTRHMEHKFPGVVKELDAKGILTCRLHPKEDNLGFFLGKGWQSVLQTNDPQEAQRRVQGEGDKLEWLEDGSANIITGPLPATRTFEGYGDKRVWFNYIPAATYGEKAAKLNSVLFGDGSPIPKSVMEESARVMNEECAEVKWEEGDVLVIDNLAVMHARRPSKPPRRILVSICK